MREVEGPARRRDVIRGGAFGTMLKADNAFGRF